MAHCLGVLGETLVTLAHRHLCRQEGRASRQDLKTHMGLWATLWLPHRLRLARNTDTGRGESGV